MRISIDLDGVIAELKKVGQDYSTVRKNDGVVSKMQALKEAGHYIIICTARHMKTCNGDVGKVVSKVGKKTLDWLDEHGIVYDEIYFGKPYAELYIDDLAHKFLGWDSIVVEDFDQDKVNILIPMAGLGSRFQDAGYTDPKPLIDVMGQPMVQWAMKSFDFLHKIKNHQLIFVVLDEHDKKYDFEQKIKNLFGEQAVVVKLEKSTRGQAETCLLAKKYIDNYNKLFIYNCDTYSVSNIWDLICSEDPDGIIPCFESNDSRYSYAKLDEFNYVSQTAEKEVVSKFATTGMYYFKRGADFVSAMEKMIMNNKFQKGEFYVAPCYNEMIKMGKKIRIVESTKNHIMGTPEELEVFIKNGLVIE